MYKSQYTPQEAQEHFKSIEESDHHRDRKDRVIRYIQRRIVEETETPQA